MTQPVEHSAAATAPTTSPRPRPIVGAIRWDAWHGDHGDPGKAVQRALAPKKYHWRLPFYAQVHGDDDVTIDGSSQAIMDREIELAHGGGLDYWAFLMYSPDESMSLGMKRYLSSEKRALMPFCMVTELGRWKSAGFIDRLISLMKEPGYQRVLGDRPLVYLGFISQEAVDQQWGGIDRLREAVDSMRAKASAAGLARPYLVIMDFNAAQGRQWQEAIAADAISSYASHGDERAASFQQLAQHAHRFWDDCLATGANVVPIVMAGWDRRPRIERPMPWEPNQKPGVGIEKYYEMPTPLELADHLQDAIDWTRRQSRATDANAIIIYAWNENDEGGYLVPTLGDGDARLKAIAKVLGKAPDQ